MYSPRQFIESRPEVLFSLIEQYPLGMLIAQNNGVPDVFHLPFMRERNDNGQDTLLAHVARGNQVWKNVKDNDDILLIFRGEDAYISPNWYPSKHEHHKQVPTWNYQAVHVRGKIIVRDDEAFIRKLLANLTTQHEAGQSVPWKMSDAPDDYISAMVKAVVGIEIAITELTGIVKLSQNKNASDLNGAAKGLIDKGKVVIGEAMLTGVTAQKSE